MNSQKLSFVCAIVIAAMASSCISPKEDIPVSSVAIAQDTAELTEGETLQLMATVSPADATNKDLTWTSSNTSVATVSDNGYVSAIKAGTSVIYAMAETKKAQCVVTVHSKVIQVESVALDQTSVTLTVGQTVTITATALPENAEDRTVTWASSDNTVATVSDGVIKALKIGSATITARAGGKENTCKVEVIPTDVSRVLLSKTVLSLRAGQSEKITATVEPDDATDKTITWTSSDETVATVVDGVVSAVKVGSASIIAKSGNVSASCEVQVVPTEVTSVALNETSLSLAVGESASLTATVSPEDATDKTVSWSSTNEKVATVNDGRVKAIGAGNAAIIAKSGDQSARCEIEVYTIPVTGITISNDNIEMVSGQSYSLTASVQPSNASDKTIIWASSNTSVARVVDGKVTAVSRGEATITASSTDNKIKAECKVSVKTKATSIKLSRGSFLGDADESYPVEVITTPEDAACDIDWSTSNPSVAYFINQSGKHTDIRFSSYYSLSTSTITAYDRISGLSTSIQVCTFIQDFTWTENTGETYSGYPLITLMVGEKHQLQYSHSSIQVTNLFEKLSDFVLYEPYVVEQPTHISIDAGGCVTGLSEGITGIKATGRISKKSGGVDRVYIKVVSSYEENEPNNDFPYATVMKPGYPLTFALSSTSDVDVIKFTNPKNGAVNEYFDIVLTYNGTNDGTSKVLRYEVYSSDYTLFGSGTFSVSDKGETVKTSRWLNTATGYVKFYFPSNYLSYPQMCPRSSFTMEVKEQ